MANNNSDAQSFQMEALTHRIQHVVSSFPSTGRQPQNITIVNTKAEVQDFLRPPWIKFQIWYRSSSPPHLQKKKKNAQTHTKKQKWGEKHKPEQLRRKPR